MRFMQENVPNQLKHTLAFEGIHGEIECSCGRQCPDPDSFQTHIEAMAQRARKPQKQTLKSTTTLWDLPATGEVKP